MSQHTTRTTGDDPADGLDPGGTRGRKQPRANEAVPEGSVPPAAPHTSRNGIPHGVEQQEPTGLPSSDRHQTEIAPKVQSGDRNDQR
jgi:hypothetical protein